MRFFFAFLGTNRPNTNRLKSLDDSSLFAEFPAKIDQEGCHYYGLTFRKQNPNKELEKRILDCVWEVMP